MAPVVALPTLRSHPGAPPAGACSARASYGHGRVVRPAPSLRCLPTLPLCPRGGGGRCPAPPYLHPPPLGGRRCVCGGGGGLSSSLRCTHVAGTTQARRRHEARRLSLCRGGGGMPCGSRRRPSTLRSHARWSPRWGLHGACSLRARSCGPSRTLSPLPPHPAALSSRGGGRFLPPPDLHPPRMGGRRCVRGGGGALVVFPPQHARGKHDASMAQARGAALVPLQGGGGACRVSPVVAPPTLRVHPRGGGGVWGGGGGALVVVPSLHACRRHDASTTQARGEALGCSGGGGVSPLGLPALLHGLGSAPQDLQPLLSLGGSRHVTAWCSVSRGCSLLCPYLLEEVCTRSEMDDEEVRAAGRTYRAPRRLLAPSAALVEGRAPVSAPNSPGGADCPSSPWCLCIHF